ncbi:MAG: lantibiotic biosynthesis protein, partial [Solirubrobacteraceae bacterium]|nr:lantibiotic biosynthesis protein [Solirubrobacteraceae bacterium]
RRARDDAPPPGLWVGRAGVAFALAQVVARPPSPSLTSWLAGWVADGAGGEHDLVSGAAGIGALALELGADPRADELLEAVVRTLAASAEPRDGGLAWATPPQRADAELGRFDLGVAHGAAGVVGVLAGALATERPPPRTRELLEGAIAFLLAQRLPGAPREGCLPYAVGGARDREPARLAWCYGDASAAVALLLAARALGAAAIARAARELAARAAARPATTAGVVDAGLCHGAAGLAQLFGRLWQLTDEEHCATAGRAWLARTLALHEPASAGRSVGGFAAMVTPQEGGAQERRPVAGLLTGAAGVALALLAACRDEDPSWDRALLASPAPASAGRW